VKLSKTQILVKTVGSTAVLRSAKVIEISENNIPINEKQNNM